MNIQVKRSGGFIHLVDEDTPGLKVPVIKSQAKKLMEDIQTTQHLLPDVDRIGNLTMAELVRLRVETQHAEPTVSAYRHHIGLTYRKDRSLWVAIPISQIERVSREVQEMVDAWVTPGENE